MHLDGEVGAVELGLQRRRGLLEPGREALPLGVVEAGAAGEADPARPGRRQPRQQAGGELLDRIGRGAVEQLVGALAARRGAAPGVALRQGVVVGLLPVRFPGAPPLAQAPVAA